MICNLPAEVKAQLRPSSMRIMIANAAPWSFALKQQYVADFPPESLFEVYGSTELGVNTILRPEDQLRKPGSCGKEAPMVEIRLYDDDGNVVTGTGPDATGELFVRSPSVFADYYKQHDKFEEDSRDGFQTVGDIAYRDDEGFIYICDRKKDMIISGGMNIYPAEIEAALEAHPDIYEAAVFGIPSEEWGELVHAVVVKRPGTDLDEAASSAHAREHLASYKVPRSISWLDELPKTGSGKVLKRELRAPFWADRASQGLIHPSVSLHRSVSCGAAPHETLGCAETLGWEVVGAIRVRDAGRPAERRQVVARQRDLRGQGDDRLGQAADDPPPGPRDPQPPRRPARVRRHAGPAQAGHRARSQGQRHGDRQRRRVRRGRRRRLPRARRDRAVRRRRSLGRRPPRPAARRSSSSTRSIGRAASR